ncbi:GNAT family N-acetyltransferase [Bacillus sp. NP157]|nr:GNAT family N-acetyltransferase [Bacillus sp. NP157]
MDQTYTFTVPRLETARFHLREYRPGDFEAFAAHLADPESMTHLNLSDRKTAWRVFGSHAGLWLLGGAGWWAIEDKATGQVLGNVGAFFRDGFETLEMGWNTYRTAWGKGVAREAGAAALAYALDVRREAKVQALISDANEASKRVAARLGFRYEGEVLLNGKTTGCYVIRQGDASMEAAR